MQSNGAGERANETPPELRMGRWLTFVLLACLVVGVYCCLLNHQLYQHRNPFFDSVSYHEQLFRVMTVSREDGILAGVQEGSLKSTTVCLPFIISALIADVVSPSRYVGIWIQVGYLAVFLISVFYYLVAIRRLRNRDAFAVCLIFLSASCIYYSNGGISDFRMDIGLCLWFGTSAIWFLAAMSRPTTIRFTVFGLACAACCLTRATAPVYLVAALAPLLMMESFNPVGRRKKLLGVVFAVGIVGAVAGWFFALNFEYLKYYYFTWNTDANAKIGLVEALGHIRLVERCIGGPLQTLLVVVSIGTAWHLRKKRLCRNTLLELWRHRDVDYQLLWLGVAPVLLMIVRRAGLNPFVCMPAIVGLVLFVCIPYLKTIERLQDRQLNRFLWVCLLVCVIFAWGRGWRRHQQKSFNTMAAQQSVMDEIIRDAGHRKTGKAAFGVMQLTELSTNSLYATLLFDRPGVQRQLNFVSHGDTKIYRVPIFNCPAAADWEALEGATDDQKQQTLLKKAEKKLDYLVAPDAASAQLIQRTHSQNHINRHLASMRAMLEKKGWQPLPGKIQVDENEFVEIYRRIPIRDRIQSATRPLPASSDIR